MWIKKGLRTQYMKTRLHRKKSLKSFSKQNLHTRRNIRIRSQREKAKNRTNLSQRLVLQNWIYRGSGSGSSATKQRGSQSPFKKILFYLKLIISVTRLGYFWKDLVAHLHTILAQLSGDFLGCFEKHQYLIKNSIVYFLGNFGFKIGTFSYIIWSLWFAVLSCMLK